MPATFDLAFIDGMHQFEYALRDFINLEKSAHGSSWVVAHDCVPLDGPTSRAERCTTFWSGDVWKLVVALKSYRPDLEVVTLPCPPTGLAIIRNLDPHSRVLQQAYDDIVATVGVLDYDYLEGDKTGRLNRIGMKRARAMWLV